MTNEVFNSLRTLTQAVQPPAQTTPVLGPLRASLPPSSVCQQAPSSSQGPALDNFMDKNEEYRWVPFADEPQFLDKRETFMSLRPRPFYGTSDPSVAEKWLEEMISSFRATQCPVSYWVELIYPLLRRDVHFWWKSIEQCYSANHVISWTEFLKEFKSKYYSSANHHRAPQRSALYMASRVDRPPPSLVPQIGCAPRCLCRICGKYHAAESCRLTSSACYRCGGLDHLARECTKLPHSYTRKRGKRARTTTSQQPSPPPRLVHATAAIVEATPLPQTRAPNPQHCHTCGKVHANEICRLQSAKSANCYRCGRLGHFARNCEKDQTYSGAPPHAPPVADPQPPSPLPPAEHSTPTAHVFTSDAELTAPPGYTIPESQDRTVEQQKIIGSGNPIGTEANMNPSES